MKMTNKEMFDVFGVVEDNVIEIKKWYNTFAHRTEVGTTFVEIVNRKSISKFDKQIGKSYDNKNNRALIIYNVDGILKGYFVAL